MTLGILMRCGHPTQDSQEGQPLCLRLSCLGDPRALVRADDPLFLSSHRREEDAPVSTGGGAAGAVDTARSPQPADEMTEQDFRDAAGDEAFERGRG